MPVIGTAGHVDHGKSTLVQALTGRDPDRLAEEKRRGLTIDLGFAWTELGGVEVGFVDVPGHEKFIKNMLAGIEAVEAVLFVVAADEGWMPQSEEHLTIIDLLGHDRGVIALTRRDLVDEDTAELAKLEIEERLEGTSLAGAPIIEVSAPTGQGLEELQHHLGALIATSAPQLDRARLWIDRVFTVSGSGTVVTGTLLGSPLGEGDDVMVWPGALAGRVRSLQSHERTVSEAPPSTRTAINLGGIETSAVARGSMLGRPGEWEVTNEFLADLRPARGMEDEFTDRGAFHLHLGSGAWPVRIRTTGGATRVRLQTAIPLTMGDRLILREVGRRAVVAGGVVIDPAPARRKLSPDVVSALAASVADPEANTADALLETRGKESLRRLLAHSGTEPTVGIRVGQQAFSDAKGRELTEAASDLVRTYHEENPLRPGMPTAAVAERLSITPEELEAIVGESLVFVSEFVRHPDFGGEMSEADRGTYDEVARQLRESGLAVPRASQLPMGTELRHALERNGDLVRIDDDLVYLPDQIDEIKDLLRAIEGEFTVAEFRDAAGVSRRQAVPLLEWLDRQGLTKRTGDVRQVTAQL